MPPGKDFDDEETLDELLDGIEIEGTNPGAPLVTAHPITGEPPVMEQRDMRLYRVATFGWQQAASDIAGHLRSSLQTHHYEYEGEKRGIVYEHGDRLDVQPKPDMVVAVIEHRADDLGQVARNTFAVTKLINNRLPGVDYRLLLAMNRLLPSQDMGGYRTMAAEANVTGAEMQLDYADRGAITAHIQVCSVTDFLSLETLGKYHFKGVKIRKI